MGLSGDNVTKEAAVGHLKSGRYDEAIASLQQVLLTQTDDPQLYSFLGMAYSQTGEHDKSIDAFEKSLAIQKSARAHYNLGLAYNSAGRYSEAQEQFQLAVDLDPAYTPAKEALSKVLDKIQASAETAPEPTVVTTAATNPEPTVVGAPVLEQASMAQSDITGAIPDFSTLGPPKAPPDLAAEKAKKELEWQERRKDYIKWSIIYGGIAGAFFVTAGFFSEGLFSTYPSILMVKYGFAKILFLLLFTGAIHGCLVGLYIGITCMGEEAGMRAGAVLGAFAGLLVGLIGGAGVFALVYMLISAVVSGVMGLIVGRIVETSVN